MAVTALTASAQRKYNPTDVTKSRQHMTHQAAQKRSFQAAEFRNAPVVSMGRMGKKLTLDASRLQPVQRTQAMPVMNQRQAKMLRTSGRLANGQLTSLVPTKTVQTNAPRKSPAFRESYMGKGVDYFSRTDTAWTMLPATASLEDGTTVNVLVDVIPLEPTMKEALSQIYPNGVPVDYTIEDNIITIKPQAIASYEYQGVTNYVTLFAANSENEDGIITMQLAEDGLLKVIDGNWITYGEFAGVPFDEDMGDSEAFLGLDELYVNVRYVYEGQKGGFTSAVDYNAHGVDFGAHQPVMWTMSRGTWTEEGDDYPVFFNLSPFDDMFSTIYPEGIYVEYTKEDNTYTVEPQVLATMTEDDGTVEYLMIFSGTADDGAIVFTIDEDGTLKTIKDECIIIAAWATSEFDPTFETYLGWYTYTDRVTYRLPDAAPVAPSDLGVDPNELILFAGLGMSGYSYNDNLALIGAYAPLTFNNATFDVATGFEWSVNESVGNDENVITSNDTNFSFVTKGDGVYEDFTLKGFNKTAESKPYTYGFGHCPQKDAQGDDIPGTIRYEAAHFYAGGSGSSFQFTDGTYATMTRQNPDNNMKFYINWATYDIYSKYSSNADNVSKIYSYQGKPATPLFITGVTIPMVEFEAKDNFNLHIGLYKCSRSATGRLTLGDLIAEGDATIENVDNQYDSGLAAVVFDELYVEDEEGMSETLDYLFIEDEFCIVIDGFDNETFSGVLGSQDIFGNELQNTWFEISGNDRVYQYTTWPTSLFIGLIDATYGYLHTEDDTDLTFSADGGTATIHVDPMYYGIDEETEEITYSLYVESVSEDGEEVDDIPAWLSFEVANEDYTTATEVDEDGQMYEYFVNGIDYDLVVTAEAMPEGVQGRTAEVVFFQRGAKLTVTVSQGENQGVTTVVTKEPLNNRHAYNLAGQRVDAAKGIVVKNGRKFIRK